MTARSVKLQFPEYQRQSSDGIHEFLEILRHGVAMDVWWEQIETILDTAGWKAAAPTRTICRRLGTAEDAGTRQDVIDLHIP